MVEITRRPRQIIAPLACMLLLVGTSDGRAGESDAELRALIEQQSKQLELQKQQLELYGKQLEALQRSVETQSVVPVSGQEGPEGAPQGRTIIDDGAVKRIVADYLQQNPGAGMPPSVQTGYGLGGAGFVIRSTPNPRYVKWDDECRIPFELRIRGRMQIVYDRYKVTDNFNHLTGRPAVQNANANRFADFSQMEIKRGNIVFEGTVFDPDLHYRVELNGFTRGLPFGFQNNKVAQTAGTNAPNTLGVSPIGGGVSVSQGVTLFESFVFYDFHPWRASKGCGEDCPEGTSKYSPTVSIIAGKLKPFFGLAEFLGNRNDQFVEFSMTDLFFSADEDSRLMAAGVQVKALEDRFFLQSIVTNGGETFTPNTLMDQYPGFITGFWYDIGGNWNEQRKAWDLFGDCIADIDYSCKPVARVGGCLNVVPHDRRSLYGDGELVHYNVVPGGPPAAFGGAGGTRLINVLNGDATLPAGAHAVDKFDAYSYSAFAAAKYKGWSVYNEWWFRNLNNFKSTANGLGNIIYQDNLGPGGAAANALFPANHALFDYGMNVATGYFIVPKKLEVAARWAWIRGQSGNINGNNTFSTATLPQVGSVHVVNGAFENYAEVNEYTVGVNWYFRRQLLKWQSDFGVYRGGNPVGAAGQSIGGFVSGVDGYLFRTQLQLAF
ncbi:MAG: hypothetical protein K2R98_11075 [Gemmataceae bacterium]|nr:hypothetical protein [Gemmataceae bacterium]